MNNPPTFTVEATAQRGQSLLQWRDEGNASLSGLHSLQMPTEVATYLARAANCHPNMLAVLRTCQAEAVTLTARLPQPYRSNMETLATLVGATLKEAS